MSGRQHERVRKRVTADLRIGAKRLKGLVVDPSTDGLFVQMEAATLPARGIEVELDLSESRFGPAMTVRGEVVRHEISGAGVAPGAGRGVGLRIIEAPPEYHAAVLAAFGGEDAAPTREPPASGPSPPETASPEPQAADTLDFEIGVDTGEARAERHPEAPARRGSGGTFQSLLSSAGAPPIATESERGRTVSGGLGASLLGGSRPRLDDLAAGPPPLAPRPVAGPVADPDLPVRAEESVAEVADSPDSSDSSDSSVLRDPVECVDPVESSETDADSAPCAAAAKLHETDETPEPAETDDRAGQGEQPEQAEAAVIDPGPAPLVLPEDAAASDRCEVLCVYDGDDLDDIYEQLEELGARPQRARLSGPTRFQSGDVAPRVFIISASEALRLELPDALPGDMVRVAVADSRSEVLGSLVARLGYDFLVRRPAHPELLRRLFQGLLFRGAERRDSERHPTGWPVQLRVGWRALPATLLDLSSGGARVVVGGEVDLLADVRLRVPRTSRDRAVSLAGRIIRKRKLEDGYWSVALRFELDAPSDAFERLRARADSGSIGPAPAPPLPWRKRLEQLWLRLRSALSPSPRPALPPASQPGAAQAAERRTTRGVLEREVLDLDPETRAPRNVLVGRDLALGGLRVDPHPSLACGEELTLALFDAAGAPLQLRGRVSRDDGKRGVVLEFVEPNADVCNRLEELVGTLPAIERLDGVTPSGVVFAQIVTDKVEAKRPLEGRN